MTALQQNLDLPQDAAGQSLAASPCWASSCGRVTLYLGYCEKLMPSIKADLVVTSPPYNLGGKPWKNLGNWKPGDSVNGKSKWRNGSDGGGGIHYGKHNDAMPWEEYTEWQRRAINLMWDCVEDHGAIYYVHKPRVIGAKLWLPLELLPPEVILRQIITWARPGGMNFNPTAFVPTMEWILLLAKPSFRLKSRAASGAGDVWRMSPERNEHPAPFPVALPINAIEPTDEEKYKTVLDPYMGSGTTGVACLRTNRKFIGIEKDPEHFEAARARITQELASGDLFRLPNSPVHTSEERG